MPDRRADVGHRQTEVTRRAALGRIVSLSAEKGDSAAARAAYSRLAALWAEADPEMRPLVREAERAAGH